MIGRIVCSKSGRDKGYFLAVVKEEDGFLYVCDGKERTLEKPKRKNRQLCWIDRGHHQGIHHLLPTREGPRPCIARNDQETAVPGPGRSIPQPQRKMPGNPIMGSKTGVLRLAGGTTRLNCRKSQNGTRSLRPSHQHPACDGGPMGNKEKTKRESTIKQ